jgi:hypothetical protein
MKQPTQYAESPALSQSDLKLFRRNITAFFNYVEMRNPMDRASTRSMDVGNIVDALLTCPEAMDDYYTDGIHCSDAIKEIIDMAITTVKNINQGWFGEDNPTAVTAIALDIDTCKDYIVQAARTKEYQKNWKDDTLFNNIKTNASRYFELRALHPHKIIIAPDLYRTANNCVQRIKADEITGGILKGFFGTAAMGSQSQMRVEKQLALFGRYSQTEIKGLLDLVLFDDRNRVIYPFDIKTVKANAQFISNYYNYGYGYQGAYYSELLKQNYPDYKVSDFRFIAGATTTDESPLLFRMPKSEQVLFQAGGIDRQGRRVVGWEETIMDYEWHKRTGQWLYPRSYYNTREMVIDSIMATADMEEDVF